MYWKESSVCSVCNPSATDAVRTCRLRLSGSFIPTTRVAGEDYVAGKKQHFIPQHFLKPFVAPGGRDYVWVYRKGRMSPIRVARRDAAAQNYFYSKPPVDRSPTLDDMVTDYETNLHRKVDDIRRLKIGDAIDSQTIAEVVTHLAVRSSHLRETVSGAIVTMVDALQNLVDDEARAFMSDWPRQGPAGPLYRMIAEELTNLGLRDATPVTESTLVDLLYVMMRERGSKAFDDTRPALAKAFEGVRADAVAMSRRAQVTALGQAMAPQPRVTALSNLTWKVVPAPAEGAALPDCTSIAFNGREWRPLLFTDSDELEAAVLAFSPTSMAVGKKAADLLLDLSQYNRHAADASYSFYVANRSSLDLSDLITRPGVKIRSSIGTLAHESIDEALTKLVQQSDERSPSEEGLLAKEKSWKSMATEGRHEYFVSFIDIADESFARTVAAEIDSIVKVFSKYYPIYSLEGFLFADDYKAALNRIDHGSDFSETVNPIESDQIVGIAMPLTVVSNGLIKTRIVLQGYIALDLISDEEAPRLEARRAISHMLASCALRGLTVTKFPDRILKPVDDPFEALLHQYSSGIFESYFCASLSVENQDDVDRQEKLALAVLCEASDRIRDKRIEYVADRDLDALFDVAANLSTNALTLIASVLGAYRGLGIAVPSTSLVMRKLTDDGLSDWAGLFKTDLEGFARGLDEWARFEELFFVHRHFQRFLAHFGIIPDRYDGEGTYVHVLRMASEVWPDSNCADEEGR